MDNPLDGEHLHMGSLLTALALIGAVITGWVFLDTRVDSKVADAVLPLSKTICYQEFLIRRMAKKEKEELAPSEFCFNLGWGNQSLRMAELLEHNP